MRLFSQKIIIAVLAFFAVFSSALVIAQVVTSPPTVITSPPITSPPSKPFNPAPIIYLLFSDDRVKNDSLSVEAGTVDMSLNVLSNDNNVSTATLDSFGGPDISNVADNVIGASYVAASGAQISLAANGVLTYDATGIPLATTGTDILFYAVDNAGTIETAEITVNYGEAPTAQDDLAFDVLFSSNLVVTDASGLLANDVLGAPAGEVASFGGGSLGGVITDNAAGDTVNVSGGLLTVNADGSFTLSDEATFVGLEDGPVTFFYRLQNDFGFSDAEQLITITSGPIAVDDTLNSKVLTSEVFSASTLFNDNGNGSDYFGTPSTGDPAATITAFGNFNGVSGNAAEFAFGTTQTIPAPINGMLIVNADGSLTVDTPTGDGSFTFQYTLDNGVGAGSIATVTVNVVPAPIAENDSYTFPNSSDQTVIAANGLFADNGDGVDFLGTPASMLTSFGGGDLGGTVTSNLAGASVALASGTLLVNNDGSFSLTGQPFNTGTFTFNYRLTNSSGTSDGVVTFIIQELPTANDDDFSFDLAANQSSPATLFADNGNGADNLGVPAATISSFGGGSLGGAITDNAASASVALAGGTLTINDDGTWTLTDQPFNPGTYAVDYRLSNAAGTSDATITFDITEQPVASNDSYTFLNTTNQSVNAASGLFVDNGSGADALGTPSSTLTSFGGGDLGGTVTSNLAGATAGLAGGTLQVNDDGSFSLTGQPFNTGTFTFNYRLTNSSGTSDGVVTFIIQELPSANDDDFTFDFAANQSSPATLFVDNGNGADNLGVPAATISSFGGGSLGGAITDNAANASVALAGGTLTINDDGTWTMIGQPFNTGTYTVDYRLTNAVGTSDATATFVITQQPTANDDSYAFQVTINETINAANGLFVDNGSGSDDLGSPASTISSYGGGDLGGVVTDVVAGSSIPFTAAGGTLQVNADGSLSLTGQPFNAGTYTFDYRLTNSVGTSDGTVTLTINDLPIAQDDSFAFTYNTNQTAPNDLFADNGSGADTVAGATLTSFGGGSLGGAVTDNPGNATVALAGGSLTIDDDGTWTLTGEPFDGGVYTVDYRLTNAGGTSDATITFDISEPPTATDDAPAMASNPGSNFHGALNTTNTVANGDSDDLDQNDDLGNPAATIASFGAIQFNNGAGVLGAANGLVTTNAAGSTVNFSGLGVGGISDGSLTVSANGSYSLTPPTNYTGPLSFQYRLTNSQGSDDGTVTLAVGTRAQCTNDAYTGSVNVPVSVAVMGVLGNDSGDGISVVSVEGSASNVGSSVAGNTAGSSSSTNMVTLNANGAFDHSPAAGFVGANTFEYDIVNGFGATGSPCTVTVTTSKVSGASAWFIDQSASGSSNYGTFDDPFTTIASFNTQNAGGANQPISSDVIYIDPDGTYNEADGINLLASQSLIGGTVQFSTVYAAVAGGGAALDSGYTTFAGTAEGSRSAIATTAGDGVDLAAENTINGVNIGNTPSGFGLDGTVVGSLSISNMDITGTGGAIRISTSGTLNAALGTVSSSSSIAENMLLSGTTGSLTVSVGGSGLSNSAVNSSAIRINGGSATFTYPGSIAKSNVGRLIAIESTTGGTKTLSGTLSSTGLATGILVQNNSGGTSTFSGVTKTVNTGPNAAVTLSSNSGANVNFTGGGLDIDTTSGAGFAATGGGTVTVQGSGNSVTSTTGTAVNITSTTIGVSGVLLRSVSSNGATNGIVLNTTGSSGGLTVTGDGSNAQNASGGHIQNSTGDGIFLTNTRDVSITQLNLTDNASQSDSVIGDDHEIDINTVTNFTYQDAVINGFGTSVGSHDDQHSVSILNLYGASLIDNVIFNDMNEDGIEYVNNNADNAVRDVLTVSNSTFNNHLGINGESAIQAEAQGTSLMGLLVDNATFGINSNGILGVLFTSINNNNSTLTVQNSIFNAGAAFGAGTISTNNADTSTSTIMITGNMINETGLNGIEILNNDNATTNVTVSNNMVDGNGAVVNNGFGIRVQQDENGTVNALIDNNSVNDISASHIRLIARDTTDNSGILNATVTNNTSSNAPFDFVFGAEVLAQDNNTVCVDLRGNNFIGNDGGFPGFGDDIRLNQSQPTATLNVEQSSAANVTTLNNADTVSVGGTVSFSAANCPQP